MKNFLTSNLLSSVILLLLPLQTPVPVLKEPRHHLKFENKYVRVIDAVLPPGDATLFHTHSIDNIPVAISGGKLKVEVKGQRGASYSTVDTGSVSFAKATYSHRITNVGESTVRFIDAEILSSPVGESGIGLPEKVTGYELVLDNESVRVYRVVLEPGQTTGPGRRGLSGLRVAVSVGRLAVETRGEKARMEETRAGDFQWVTGKREYTIKNVGSERYEAIEIEWK
jgi:quercetin dioxygenase-like cupin family protein